MTKKLIASDIDGTLLPFGTYEIDPKLFQLIEDLRKKNVLFVPASGRTIHSLRKLFEPVQDSLSYLSENGGAVWYFDQKIGEFPIPFETLSQIHQMIKETEGLEGYANSPQNGYILEDTLKNGSLLEHPFIPPMIRVPSLENVEDQVVKITAMTTENNQSEHFFKDLKERFGDQVDVAMAGPDVIDFCSTNKGIGLQKLTEYLNLTPNDVFAFGDNYNDLEMLDFATHSYMIETDDPVRRKAAKYLITDPIREIEKIYLNL